MKHVEEIPFDARVQSKKADIIFSDKNQSFYRRDSQGREYCWMVVDANTGTVDIRDSKGESLFVIDADQQKVFVSGNPSIDLKDKAPDDLLGRIVYAAKKIDLTPKSILDQISKDGLMLQAQQRLTARADGQLLINNKTFKGEKGDRGEKGDKGDKGENAPDVGWRLAALESTMNSFEFTQVKEFDFQSSYKDDSNRWIEAAFVYFGPANKSNRAVVLHLELNSCGATSINQDGQLEYKYGAYIDFEISFQAGNNNPEAVIKRASVFSPAGGNITQTLTFPHESGAEHRVYRIKFKKGKFAKRAWFKGSFSAVQL